MFGLVNNQRDVSIDILRAVALLSIILVHTDPPSIIAEFRQFDVPLMVFISTTVYKPSLNQAQYYIKRAKRLLIPTWIFIAVYMLIMVSVQLLGIMNCGLTSNKIILSFMLFGDGMGYVWIIRVFLLCALITPWLDKFLNSKLKYANFIGGGLVILIIQDLLVSVGSVKMLIFQNLIFSDIILYLVGYSFIVYVALYLKMLQEIKKTIVVMLWMFIYVTYYTVKQTYLGGSEFGSISAYKYPPQSIYLVYGIFMSIALWVGKAYIVKVLNCKLLRFLGQNTLWIYFHHVLPIMLLNLFISNWLIKFLLVLPITLGLYFIQFRIANRFNQCKFTKYLIG